MKAIRLEAHGGPEQLKLYDVPELVAGPGEALVQVAAAGVNFMDIGVRTGQLWRHLTPPFVPGVEGAGRVIALGEGVKTLSVGQRVSWVYVPGSYAERIVADADALLPVRDLGPRADTRRAIELYRQLFDWVERGELKVNISQRYPLADAAHAHSDMASRRTTSKLLLIPKLLPP